MLLKKRTILAKRVRSMRMMAMKKREEKKKMMMRKGKRKQKMWVTSDSSE